MMEHAVETRQETRGRYGDSRLTSLHLSSKDLTGRYDFEFSLRSTSAATGHGLLQGTCKSWAQTV